MLNPYYTARFPYCNLDHGAVRLLPIELTMVNDLPIMLDRNRAPIRYGSNPELSLYLLDRNAYAPEPAGLWVAGRRRARHRRPDVEEAVARCACASTSPVPNRRLGVVRRRRTRRWT